MVNVESIESSVAELLKLYECKDCHIVNFILIKNIYRFFKFMFDNENAKFIVILPSSNKELEKIIKGIGKNKVRVFYSLNLKENSCIICSCNK
ncbi:hypothetical protein [Sulfurisphaera tokodaii]|uniref:Uncharacterized protein n=2 Tax=Sulfurisphaera tokodaii TaxID=111955 RepID=Q974H4_SULTO|nr:hypothetical protein [Sulfurisphaera tokodaii]BAB65684.1 hypothetical protein STK_06824 [Sulfurisphaera tokodaii str. 7]HII74537.1 hypothetical protein [Sulfurisphaera tokodaii]